MTDNSMSLSSSASLTHFFVYKKKYYPFNMDIFKLFSQYYNKQPIHPIGGINIVDDDEEDNYNLTETAITDFIGHCQNQPINLHKENVISIHKLSKKFIVPSLLKATEKYVLEHRQQYIEDYLTSNIDPQESTVQETEDIISNDFINYISDERLLQLPVPVLNRIVTKYRLKKFENQRTPEEATELIDFLFKCLDKYGKEGSILFDGFDFGRSNSQVIRKLMNEYTEKFDFRFITNVHLLTIYDLEKEHSEHEKQMAQLYKEFEKNINEKSQQNQDLLLKEIDILKNTVSNLDQKIKEQENDYDNVRKQMIELKNENDKLEEQVNKLIEQLNTHEKFIKKYKEENSGPSSILFKDESSAEGILNKLQNEVTITAGGKHDPQHPLSSLLSLDDNDYFINSFKYTPKSVDDSFILFDFGPNKRIDPISYFIKSGNVSAFQEHPRSWTIDASNDGSTFKVIDKKFDDSTLRGDKYTGLFKINTTIVNNGVKGYRYIRFIQNNSWMNGSPYMINLTYFEFYGFVYDLEE